ncbi:hypothetical protein HK100_002955 [Physocladia obscura]|uniref:Uncharacterized protein n=1 Tax=Physocladia obscura TaxID=109957 RepID=A0AAD5SXE6_9FUNG|nr:hypothetical protein HK100_002955 [Physocladia obscura]
MSISKIATMPNAMNTTKTIYQMWRSSKKTKLGVRQFPLCIECRERYFILAPQYQDSHERPLSLSEDGVISEQSFAESEATMTDSITYTHNVEKCACCVNMTTQVAEIHDHADDEYDVNNSTGIYSETHDEKLDEYSKNFVIANCADESKNLSGANDVLESIQSFAIIRENINFEDAAVDNHQFPKIWSNETEDDLELKQSLFSVVSTISEPALNVLNESESDPLSCSDATEPLQPVSVPESLVHRLSSLKISTAEDEIARTEIPKEERETRNSVYLFDDKVCEVLSESSDLNTLPTILEYELPAVNLLFESTGNVIETESLPELTITNNTLEIISNTVATPKVEHKTADISELSVSESQIGPNWSISSISSAPPKSVSFESDSKSEAIQRSTYGNTPRNSPVLSAAVNKANNETLEKLFDSPIWQDDVTKEVERRMHQEEVYISASSGGHETPTAIADIRHSNEFFAPSSANAPFSLHKKYIRTKATFSGRAWSRHPKSILSGLSVPQSWAEQTNKIRRKSEAAKIHIAEWWNRISQKN